MPAEGNTDQDLYQFNSLTAMHANARLTPDKIGTKREACPWL